MSKRTKAVTLAFFVPLLAIVIICIVPSMAPEPKDVEYHGKTLYEWMNFATMGGVPRSTNEEAEDAVRALGTNALPTLVRWIEYQPTPAMKLANYIPNFVHLSKKTRARFWAPFARQGTYAIFTDRAFRILGTNGVSAIPELARIAKHADNYRAHNAVNALFRIGPAAIPALIEIGNLPNGSAGREAIIELGYLGSNSPVVATEILKLSGDRSVDASYAATWVLKHMKVSAADAVPVLTRALHSEHWLTREAAAESLAVFGTNALSSVDSLRAACLDPSGRVRDMATNTLKTIAQTPGTNLRN